MNENGCTVNSWEQPYKYNTFRGYELGKVITTDKWCYTGEHAKLNALFSYNKQWSDVTILHSI